MENYNNKFLRRDLANMFMPSITSAGSYLYEVKNYNKRTVEDIIKEIEYYLKKGAELDFIDENGNNALHLVLNGCEDWVKDDRSNEVIEYLLKKGIDVKKENNNGLSPLDVAVRNYNDNAILLLVEHYYGNLNKLNNKKQSLLIKANLASFGQIKRKNYYNEFKEWKKTPYNTTKALIKAGINLYVKDNKNKSIFDYSKKFKFKELKKCLSECNVVDIEEMSQFI